MLTEKYLLDDMDDDDTAPVDLGDDAVEDEDVFGDDDDDLDEEDADGDGDDLWGSDEEAASDDTVADDE